MSGKEWSGPTRGALTRGGDGAVPLGYSESPTCSSEEKGTGYLFLPRCSLFALLTAPSWRTSRVQENYNNANSLEFLFAVLEAHHES